MKISELLARLVEIQRTEGDRQVEIEVQDQLCAATEIEVRTLYDHSQPGSPAYTVALIVCR